MKIQSIINQKNIRFINNSFEGQSFCRVADRLNENIVVDHSSVNFTGANAYGGKEFLKIMQKADNYNNFIIKTLLNSLQDKNKKVLDFGSGSGHFAELLRAKGVKDLTCVEIDKEFCERSRKLGFKVFEDLNEIDDSGYDFIYSLNVLEHIEEDKKSLLLLKNKLNKNGKLLIYVPAFPSLYSSFDKQIGHLRRYRKEDLVDFLQENDFKVLNAKYTDSIGFLLAHLYKHLSKNQGIINSLQVRIFDKLLFPIGKVFDKVTKGTLFGKNLIIEAQSRS